MASAEVLTPTIIRPLASGTLVEVDPITGKATFLRCNWLVEVPSGNPEPDEPSDLWTVIECGAKVLRHPEHVEGFTCEAGHDRLPYEIEHAPGGPAWQREQAERFAETGSFA